jgi:hypothetical protein
MCEIKYVKIILALDPTIYWVIDIVVLDIPEAYGFLLIRDWSQKI